MDIHHAMVIHTQPHRVFAALTQPAHLATWMDAPTITYHEADALLELHYDQGQRSLKLFVSDRQDTGRVQWRVVQPIWPPQPEEQCMTWTFQPFHGSTLVDMRLDGWLQDDDIYASVSYKLASFMVRLKLYLGDMRELHTLLERGQVRTMDLNTSE